MQITWTKTCTSKTYYNNPQAVHPGQSTLLLSRATPSVRLLSKLLILDKDPPNPIPGHDGQTNIHPNYYSSAWQFLLNQFLLLIPSLNRTLDKNHFSRYFPEEIMYVNRENQTARCHTCHDVWWSYKYTIHYDLPWCCVVRGAEVWVVTEEGGICWELHVASSGSLAN